LPKVLEELRATLQWAREINDAALAKDAIGEMRALRSMVPEALPSYS